MEGGDSTSDTTITLNWEGCLELWRLRLVTEAVVVEDWGRCVGVRLGEQTFPRSPSELEPREERRMEKVVRFDMSAAFD